MVVKCGPCRVVALTSSASGPVLALESSENEEMQLEQPICAGEANFLCASICEHLKNGELVEALDALTKVGENYYDEIAKLLASGPDGWNLDSIKDDMKKQHFKAALFKISFNMELLEFTRYKRGMHLDDWQFGRIVQFLRYEIDCLSMLGRMKEAAERSFTIFQLQADLYNLDRCDTEIKVLYKFNILLFIFKI